MKDRYQLAALNLELVRDYMAGHLGCQPKEIAFALGLSSDQARRAVRKIRQEWKSSLVASASISTSQGNASHGSGTQRSA